MTTQARRAKRWPYLLPLLLGGLALLPGIQEIGINRKLAAHGQTADGEVIAIDKMRAVSGGQPVVTFQTHDGHAVQKVFDDPLGGSYRVGEQVAVRYDPQAPLKAKILSPYGMYAGIVLPFALALLFWSIAVVVLVRRPRSKPADGDRETRDRAPV